MFNKHWSAFSRKNITTLEHLINMPFILFCLCLLPWMGMGQRSVFTDHDLLNALPASSNQQQSYFEEKWIEGDKEQKIHAFTRVQPEHKTVVLYFHGNGENLWSKGLQRRLKAISKLNFGIVAIDYPGYGKTIGEQRIQNLYKTAESALTYTKKQYPKQSIVVWGHSLGTVAALHITKSQSVDLLVCEGTISNLKDLEKPLEDYFTTQSGKKIDLIIDTTRHFDNRIAASQNSNRTIFIHGAEDQLAKIEHAQEVFNNLLTEDKQFIVLPKIGHYCPASTMKQVVKKQLHPLLK